MGEEREEEGKERSREGTTGEEEVIEDNSRGERRRREERKYEDKGGGDRGGEEEGWKGRKGDNMRARERNRSEDLTSWLSFRSGFWKMFYRFIKFYI